MDEILTVREVADYLKLSRTTVWRWCNDGKLHAFKVGRGWRIHRSEMDRIVGQALQTGIPRESRATSTETRPTSPVTANT